MRQGIVTEINWGLAGAQLAQESEKEQIAFIKSFLKECQTWGTHHQIELQLAWVNSGLTDEEREMLAMLSYKGEK